MFRLKWDGNYVAGLSKMSALKRSTDPVVHREGGDPTHERKRTLPSALANTQPTIGVRDRQESFVGQLTSNSAALHHEWRIAAMKISIDTPSRCRDDRVTLLGERLPQLLAREIAAG